MTLTGTRVPQDMLAHSSTTLRQPQTEPQAFRIQTQKTQKQHNQPNKRLDLLTRLGIGKRPQNKMN